MTCDDDYFEMREPRSRSVAAKSAQASKLGTAANRQADMPDVDRNRRAGGQVP